MLRPHPLIMVALTATVHAAGASAQSAEASWRPDGRVVINRDVGLLVGIGAERVHHDARGSRISLSGIRIERSTLVGAFALAGWGERRLAPHLGVSAASEFSGVEVLRYFGTGNETPRRGGRPIRTSGHLHALAGELSIGERRERSFGIGIVTRHHSFIRNTVDSLADLPGIGTFSIAGPRVRWTRVGRIGSDGVAVEATAAWYPLSLDLAGGDFADLSIASAWRHRVTRDSGLVMITKLRGTRIIGDAPFQELARLGGGPWLRGYQRDRFIGDVGAAAGGIELQFRIGAIDSVAGRDVSATVGALAFIDAGRVWHRGERSSRWHHSTGVGLWLKPRGSRFGLDDAPQVYGALVRAEGRFSLDGGVGIRF